MMRDAISNFAEQFSYEPRVENVENFQPKEKFVVAGMGGSHLAAGILRSVKPELDIIVHRDYGLPSIFDLSPRLSPRQERGVQTSPSPREGRVVEGRERLIIASSYSGNTEETISAFKAARENQLPLIAIATGGKLIELAKQHQAPYIQMPDTGIQPRSALGFSFRAMLLAMGEEELLKESEELATRLKPDELESRGKVMAEELKGQVPVIYSSTRNLSVAYNWKIKFNETGKIPAFYNVFPELNHNEMTGLDVKDSSRGLSEKFHFIFLKDSDDHPQIQKRTEVTKQLYKDRGLPVEIIGLEGETRLERIFNSLLLADWLAHYTAETYGLESEQVPMVEEFKKLINQK